MLLYFSPPNTTNCYAISDMNLDTLTSGAVPGLFVRADLGSRGQNPPAGVLCGGQGAKPPKTNPKANPKANPLKSTIIIINCIY